MSPFALNLEKTRDETQIVSVEPAINVFGSMLLVSKRKDDPGIHEWVAKTREQMSAEELARHHLVTIGFHYAILPQSNGFRLSNIWTSLKATPPSGSQGTTYWTHTAKFAYRQIQERKRQAS